VFSHLPTHHLLASSYYPRCRLRPLPRVHRSVSLPRSSTRLLLPLASRRLSLTTTSGIAYPAYRSMLPASYGHRNMYLPWALRLTLASHGGARVPFLRIGTNQGRVAWTAMTKILAMRVHKAHRVSNARGRDRLAGKARGRNIAHKIKIKCRRARERVAFLAVLRHWLRSNRTFPPPAPRSQDYQAL